MRARDKEIAELKGLKPYKAFHDDYVYNHMIHDEYESYEVPKYIPHWSTDRNDAWELWDELPDEKSYFQNMDYHRIEIRKVTYSMNLSIFEGTSFADAVSKAWIEWKKQKTVDNKD